MTVQQAEVAKEEDFEVVVVTTEEDEGMKGNGSPMSKVTKKVAFSVIKGYWHIKHIVGTKIRR